MPCQVCPAEEHLAAARVGRDSRVLPLVGRDSRSALELLPARVAHVALPPPGQHKTIP